MTRGSRLDQPCTLTASMGGGKELPSEQVFVLLQEVLEELAPLSVEQQSITDRVVAGHSVFFTGCAGALSRFLRALWMHLYRSLPR